MNNTNLGAVKHMAATCAAIQTLLGGKAGLKHCNVYGGTAYPEQQSDQMAKAIKQGTSLLIMIFRCEDDSALLENMMLFSVSKRQQLTISYCSLVKAHDGRFALRLMNREHPTEYVVSRSSGRFVCRSVRDDNKRALAELRGLEALLAEAVEPHCRDRPFQLA